MKNSIYTFPKQVEKLKRYIEEVELELKDNPFNLDFEQLTNLDGKLEEAKQEYDYLCSLQY
jgi:hypothetical protein